MEITVSTKYSIGDKLKVTGGQDWRGKEFEVRSIYIDLHLPGHEGEAVWYEGLVKPDTSWRFISQEVEGVK